MLADGGEAIADLAVLRDQAALFGPVASDPTAWRLLADLDEPMLAELRAARAAAREVAWAQHTETRGELPAPTVADQQVPGLVLDVDASIVLCHSDKESATRTWKKPSASTRCSVSWTTPARPCRVCCGKAGPGRTRPLTTSPSSTTPSPRSPMRIGTAPRSCCAPIRPAPATASSPTSVSYATSTSISASPSAWRSPNRSGKPSGRSPTGSPPSTSTATFVNTPKSARSLADSPPTVSPKAPDSSSAANDPTPAPN